MSSDEIQDDMVNKLALMMESVVRKRKTYPKKIMELEYARTTAMLKQYEEATVILDEKDSQKDKDSQEEFKSLTDSIKNSLAQIKKGRSSTLIEEKYQKAIKKSVEIHQFLDFVRSR